MKEISANALEKSEQMEENNKKLLYEARKKSAVIAVLLNVVIPGAGYAYCGNYILGLTAFCISVMLWYKFLLIGKPALIFVFMFWCVLIIDGVLASSRTNRNLKKEIFNS